MEKNNIKWIIMTVNHIFVFKYVTYSSLDCGSFGSEEFQVLFVFMDKM